MAPGKYKWELQSWALGEIRAALIRCISDLYPETLQFLERASIECRSYFLGIYGEDWESKLTARVPEQIFTLCYQQNSSVLDELSDTDSKFIFKIRLLTDDWIHLTGFGDYSNFTNWAIFSFISAAFFSSDNYVDCLVVGAKFSSKPRAEDIDADWNIEFQDGKRIMTLKENDSPAPPKLPHYHGQGKEAYKTKCLALINLYIDQLDEYMMGMNGYTRPIAKKELNRHMRWLVRRIKEKWTWERIQEEEERLNGGTGPGLTAIQDAVSGRNGVARLLGFQSIAGD